MLTGERFIIPDNALVERKASNLVCQRSGCLRVADKGGTLRKGQATFKLPGGDRGSAVGFARHYYWASNPFQNWRRCKRPRGKIQAITRRHEGALVSIRIMYDVELNPGPKKVWLCTTCRQEITRKQWFVKCNICLDWIHWDCTDLEDEDTWTTSFISSCCSSNIPAPTVYAQTSVDSQRSPRQGESDTEIETTETISVEAEVEPGNVAGRWKEEKMRRHLARQTIRNWKWESRARLEGKAQNTVIWTWNLQKARVQWPTPSRLAEIVHVIANSFAEVVLFSEIREQQSGVLWIKS